MFTTHSPNLNQGSLSRSEVLREYQISEIGPFDATEEAYQGLTELASSLSAAPSAYINLFNSTRQWTKAHSGASWLHGDQDLDFCRVVVAQGEPLIVNDLRADERFSTHPLVSADPQLRFYAGFPLIAQNGVAIGTLCVLDVQPRTLDEQQLKTLTLLSRQVMGQLERHRSVRKSEITLTQMKTLVEHLKDAILAEDLQGKIIFANQRFISDFGLPYSSEELVGKSAATLFQNLRKKFKEDDFLTRVKYAFGQPIKKEEEWFDGRTFESEFIPVFSADEYQGLLWVFRDVSEQNLHQEIIKKQQLMIVDSAKLSALGEMAAGVAHEINNPLAIIQGRAAFLVKHAKDPSPIANQLVLDTAQSMISVVDRIAKIIKGLKSFAREQEVMDYETVKLSDIINDTLVFCLERFKNKEIEFTISEVPESIQITCHAVQIAQVLLNLLNNAYDGVSAELQKWVKLEISETDEEVKIRVQDCGPPILKSVSEKMFNPFFTTKEMGTGIGLSISKGIMEAHHGSLEHETVDGHPCFTITLPKTLITSDQF